MVFSNGGGKTARGIIRYRCPVCKKSQCLSKQQTWKTRQFIDLFEQYILNGTSYVQLAYWSGYSVRTLEERFHALLLESPPTLVLPSQHTEESYLILDALWFGKTFCMMLYRESHQKNILHISFLRREYGSLIAKDLRLLTDRGYRFTGVVSDGGTGINRAIQTIFRHIPHQVCMAHTHRDAINAIGKHSKDERVRQLRRLADHLWLIESKEAHRWWKRHLAAWMTTHWQFLDERTKDVSGRWWFTHAGVRKAARTLLASEKCFTFLSHHLMPKTTNAIEGQFSMVSMKHLVHRGMKHERIQPFLIWFTYFYNKRLLSQRKSTAD